MKFVLAAALLAACASNSPRPPGESLPARSDVQPPNIVLIMADDLGYECIGANGGESYATPRINRMADEGQRYTRAYATPLCTPSRVQIMTGRYGFRNYERFGYLAPTERTFANELGDAGYETCMVGKWQLTYGDIDPKRPRDFGFDEWTLWNTRSKPGSRYHDPLLDVNGTMASFPGRYGPDVVLDHALEFMSREREAPFLLYYPMILPHAPFVSTPQSAPELRGQAAYAAMVEYVDHVVGRVLDRLEEQGLGENTLVIFVGDNGTPRNIVTRWEGLDYPGGKGFHNERGMRVPLVVRWPGSVDPGVPTDLIDFSDVLPTLLEVAGADRHDPDVVLDGVSFAPRLLGRPGTPRAWTLCHYDPRWNVPGKPGRAVFDGRFRLYGDGRLIDHDADPIEGVEVAASDPAGQGARSRLGAVLESLPSWDPPEKARRPRPVKAAPVNPASVNPAPIKPGMGKPGPDKTQPGG